MSTQAQSSLAVQTRPLVDGSDLFVQILASLARSPEIARSPWERERVMAEWRASNLRSTSEADLGAYSSELGAGGSGGSDHGCRDRCSGDNDDADPDWDATSSEICGCLARSRGMPFFMALDGLWPGVPFGYFEICTGLDGDILGCCVDVTDRVATLFDVQQPRTIGGHYVAV